MRRERSRCALSPTADVEKPEMAKKKHMAALATLADMATSECACYRAVVFRSSEE